MRKIILITIVSFYLQSCTKNDFFSEGTFYKMIDTKKKYEMDITFLKDSTMAYNLDSLKTCSWEFIKYSKNKKGLFLVTKELDTTWLKIENEKIIMVNGNEKNSFNEINFSSKKTDSLSKIVKTVKNFSDKEIIFGCEIKLNEIPYFYEKAIMEIKSNLKNPNSAKFRNIYIHTYKDLVDGEFQNTEIIVVSVEVEATNSFGGFIVDTFYVYFTPEEKNSKKYKLKFSDSSIYNSFLEEMEELEVLE